MPVLADPVVAQTFIYARLAGDTALVALVGASIYADNVPIGGTLPAVVFKQMDPGMDVDANSRRVLSNPLYIVEAVMAGRSYGALGAFADRIDAVLQNATGTAAGGRILDCRREKPYQMPEFTDGQDYRHLGGYYRLLVQSPA